jgi:DNA polymerase-3 subunit epsilon
LLRVTAEGLADDWPEDTPMQELPVVCLDTETTGRDPEQDRIIEFGCVVWKGGQIVSRHNWLINPGMPIPAEAQAVHGISDEQVADCPTFTELADDILEALEGAVPMAYNAEFDRNFLMAELRRTSPQMGGLPPAARPSVTWLDPLTWARTLQANEKSRALGDVCARLGIELDQAHRANHDAEAALKVHLAFLANPSVPRTYAAFVAEQARLDRQFAEQRQRWRKR